MTAYFFGLDRLFGSPEASGPMESAELWLLASALGSAVACLKLYPTWVASRDDNRREPLMIIFGWLFIISLLLLGVVHLAGWALDGWHFGGLRW